MTEAPAEPPRRAAASSRRGVFARLASPRPAGSRWRRRFASGARMLAALGLVGGFYAALAPSAAAQDSSTLSPAAAAGKSLYDNFCISCHGENAQGVVNKGPSLIGVGSAAVEFQVSTGRMPAAGQGPQIGRKQPTLTDTQARDIGAYIQELGGGPQIPEGTDFASLGDVAAGGALFRVNCSSCHAFSAGGGALSSGKFAPSLEPATDRQIYAAMLTGPQNMPVFGDNQLTPQEKYDIIAYIENMKSDQDPGGLGLGRLGPVPEFLVIFLIGMVGLIFATLWIAGKS